MHPPDFWQRRGLAARALAPLGVLHGASVALKAALASPYRVSVPVLCIGNLTVGGSGKTPVAMAVAEALQGKGMTPFFLTRGYGGSHPGPMRVHEDSNAVTVGDEALLLGRVAPTIVARDRAKGAALAISQGANAIVMDDGHQNFKLAKTLSVVVVDGQTGFGNEFMLPAGPLRESVTQGLARADAVVIMGDGTPALGNFAGPVLRAHLEALPNTLAGRDVFAFAGIGRPRKFLDTIVRTGATVTGTKFFPDHHPYSGKEMTLLRQRAGSALLVTTEKDLVRLPPEQRQGVIALAVRAQFDGLENLLGRLAS